MSNINTPICVVGDGNTGLPDCVFTPEKMVGAILIPKSKTFTDEELEAFIATLQVLTVETKSKRAYPIFSFEEITDNSEEETVNTLGYGSKQLGKEGKYDWTFRITKGGLCLNNNLRGFNASTMKVLFVDDNGVIYGTRNSAGLTAGMTLDFFYAKPFKINDGSNATIFNVRFALSKPEEFNEDVVYVQTSVDVEESVKGIINLELSELAVESGKITVGIQTACDKVDVYDSLSTLLADGDLWTLTKDGVAVAISGVTVNDTLSGWDIAFTGVDTHIVSLTTAKLLAAADIGAPPDNGYEADELTFGALPLTT